MKAHLLQEKIFKKVLFKNNCSTKVSFLCSTMGVKFIQATLEYIDQHSEIMPVLLKKPIGITI